LFDYQDVFKTKTGSVLDKAREYLKSLWLSMLTNIERLTETGIPESYHNLHHFISESPWDGFQLMGSITEKIQQSRKS